MHTCPKCTRGKMEITMQSIPPNPKIDGKSLITCIHCEGSGKLDDEQLAEIKSEDDMWCTCSEIKDHHWDFYEDGDNGEIYKHHYRHKLCGKVLQIG